MKKMLRNSFGIALGLLCLNQSDVIAQTGCYSMKVASSNLYLTNTGQTLKVKAATNQADQIFLLNEIGPYYVIRPTAGNPNGNLVLFPSGGRVSVGGPFSGSSPEYFTRSFIENDPANSSIKRYGFFKDGQVFGIDNWGLGFGFDGGNAAQNDTKMAPASEATTFGANKWVLESKTCPSWVNSCDFALSVATSNATPAVGQDFTLTTTCTGPGCFGVSYEWLPNGNETSIGGMVQTVNVDYAMHINYIMRGEKTGCTTQYGNVHVDVGGTQPTSFNQCIESENSSGTGSITSDPNASNGSTRGTESSYNHYVDYAVTGVPSPGIYNLKLRYYSSSAPSVNVSVSQSGFSQNVNLPNSGAWNIVPTEQTIAVNLASGNNTIRISGIGGGSCRQDKICVTNPNSGLRIGVGETISQGETSHELHVFPNPSKGEFEVEFYLEKGEPADLTITSISGNTLQKRSVVGKGFHREKFDMGNGTPGMYLFNVMKRDKVEVKKILINK